MKNHVKIGRVKANLTQQQLADVVGITRQTVSLIEKGKYNPSLKVMFTNLLCRKCKIR